MERDRSADLATLREVYEAAQQRDQARAATLAQRALDSGLEHPLLFNVLALKLEHEQRVAEAAALLERAVRIAPKDVGVRNALGLCLLRLERPADALVQFEALLALNPNLSFAQASRGAALLALGSFAAAETSYRRALAQDPRQGVAMAGLAHIASRRGQFAEGRRWAEQALSLLPGFPDAVLSLAACELGAGAAEQARTRLQGLLAEPRLEPFDRAHAQGLLGDVLDAQARPAEAFAAYTACNDSLRRHYAAAYGAQRALEYAQSLSVEFEGARSEDWRLPPPAAGAASAAATASAPPIFLLGFPRSGTTLLEVALEGDPRVVCPGEHDFLIDAIREYMSAPAELLRLPQARPADIERLRRAYWTQLAQSGTEVGSRVLLDKQPLNTLKLPLIARLFPDAKVLFVYRDPRDVVLSCFRRRFQMSAPMYELLTLEGAARYYDALMRFAERCRALLPLAIRAVRYESLVSDFDRELQEICAFVGLDWNPAMREFAPRTQRRASATPSTAQLARGLDASGIAAWRRYEAQLAPALPLLEPWVQRFGYASR
jgi:Tfp pilus assembly protein PilF